jgi:hypothetical protein
MAAAEMLELRGTRAQQDFLDSVQLTDDSWATSQRISMIAKQELGGSFMCCGECSDPKDHVFCYGVVLCCSSCALSEAAAGSIYMTYL